ncbi:unnamed protein product, partial [Prorocentrum cordatum]
MGRGYIEGPYTIDQKPGATHDAKYPLTSLRRTFLVLHTGYLYLTVDPWPELVNILVYNEAIDDTIQVPMSTTSDMTAGTMKEVLQKVISDKVYDYPEKYLEQLVIYDYTLEGPRLYSTDKLHYNPFENTDIQYFL